MPVRLNDAETEKLVLTRCLLTPEQLAPFRVQASVDSAMLFDILVTEKIITPEIIAELESSAPPPSPPRSITSGPVPVAGSGATFLARRTSRTRVFEDAPAAKPAAAPSKPPSNPAIPVAMPAAGRSGFMAAAPAPRTPSSAALPPVSLRPVSSPALAAVAAAPVAAIAERALPHGWGGLAPSDTSPGHVQQYLMAARHAGASDLYLTAGAVPTIAWHGQIRPLDGCTALYPEQTAAMLQQLMTSEQWKYFEHSGDLCFSYAFGGGGGWGGGSRYRVTGCRHRGGCDAACRIVPEQIATLEQLWLPEGCAKLAQFSEGLVLIASPANGGKTTTMMAVLQAIKASRHAHIITLEDPIEYLLEPGECQIEQREIGTHSASFAAAFQAALREDPDVIVISELRDYATTQIALSAAEAGHLVLSTVAAPDCARAIDRLFECPAEPAQLRGRIADNLRAIMGQQMIPKADGQGRAPACELLLNSISVGNIIREAKTQGLVNVMQTGRQQGMIMFDDSLKSLVEDGVISGETAHARAKNKAAFKQYLPEAEKPAEAPKALEPARTAPAAPPKPPLPGRK